MGTFSWPIEISNPNSGVTREIPATVDTGATYTVLPSGLLRELGIAVTRVSSFELGDGRVVDLDMGEARATINGESTSTWVVFGENNAPPLLGAVTLEELLLAVDPIQERLVPTRAIMY